MRLVTKEWGGAYLLRSDGLRFYLTADRTRAECECCLEVFSTIGNVGRHVCILFLHAAPQLINWSEVPDWSTLKRGVG